MRSEAASELALFELGQLPLQTGRSPPVFFDSVERSPQPRHPVVQHHALVLELQAALFELPLVALYWGTDARRPQHPPTWRGYGHVPCCC